jgi:hypothetical protein
MWVTLAKIAIQLLPKDKLMKIVIFAPLALALFIGLLFSAPGTVIEHIPLADNTQYYYYIKAAEQMKNETGIIVNWQQIIAIDAVLLEQNFTKSSQARAYGYKSYFIREETVRVSKTCQRPIEKIVKGKKVTVKEDYDCSYNKTVYYARNYDEVLQLLVDNQIITTGQIPLIKNYTVFELSMEEGGDDNEDIGIRIQGNIVVRETIFAWPLPIENNRINSPYGFRVHPVTGIKGGHKGTDLAARNGTEVYAIADGEVIQIGEVGTGGNAVYIRHKNNVISKYMHLSIFYVTSIGQPVKRGDLIGYSGDTGRVTGPHLHFQIEVNGKPANPMNFY